MISIAVLDDCAREADNIKRLVVDSADVTGGDVRVDVFTEGADFLENFKNDYDIVFLDIEMPGFDGMTIAKKIRARNSDCCIIFVTNMPQYAIDGYTVDASGYILKPIKTTDFRNTLKKAVNRTLIKKEDETNIMLSGKSGYKILVAKDIYFVEVMDHDLVFYTKQGEIRERGQLKNIEEKLERAHFYRCSNCYLVNFKYIDSIDYTSVVVNGKVLSLSRSRKKDFINKYMEYTR